MVQIGTIRRLKSKNNRFTILAESHHIIMQSIALLQHIH